MTDFAIDIKPSDQGLVVRVAGRGTADHATELDAVIDRVIERRPALVVLDLAEMRFISSYAIGAIVRLGNDLPTNKSLRLAGVHGDIEEAFRQSRLDERYPIYPTVESALEVPAPSTED